MKIESITNAFRNILTTYKFDENRADYEELFAIKRFAKKMEVPNRNSSEERKQKCFKSYIEFDESLPRQHLLKGKWYKARLRAHEVLRTFSLQPVEFTSGSEVFPTYGRNSIESKLSRSRWTCTPDCWDLWAEIAYRNRAIKRACRQRFERLLGHNAEMLKLYHSESWEASSNLRYQDRAFFCFKRMLCQVTEVVEASRFSTVRKNNENDRPIDIQPLCNLLVQRCVGLGIRKVLLESFGVDLLTLADKHGDMISDPKVSTIDLKTASDSVTNWLCDFLFPKSFSSIIKKSRTEYTQGLDGNYYLLNKVSSMGNGFTFELMTLIITLVGREVEDSFSVFGDDIICRNENAQEVIELLSDVGFVVNTEKSFINSEFRESCGANFHDRYGYLKSYDFEYPNTIMDCIVSFNKLTLLATRFPQFRRLRGLLSRAIPLALRGTVPVIPSVLGRGHDQDLLENQYFWFFEKELKENAFPLEPQLESFLREVLRFEKVKTFYGFRYDPKELTPVRDHVSSTRQYGKYLMYLHGGRRTKDIITGRGDYVKFAIISDGYRTFRFRDIRAHHKSVDT